MSLEQVTMEALKLRMDTRLSRSNWCFGPLSQAQVHHAAFEAMVLILIETALRRRNIFPPQTFQADLRDLIQRIGASKNNDGDTNP